MGLRIDYYPTRLTDADLDYFSRMAIVGWERAPCFCSWLVTIVQDEQLRRLQIARGQCPAIEVPRLPLDWPGRELSAALRCVTALAGLAPSHTAGRFIDAVADAVTASAGARLDAIA